MSDAKEILAAFSAIGNVIDCTDILKSFGSVATKMQAPLLRRKSRILSGPIVFFGQLLK